MAKWIEYTGSDAQIKDMLFAAGKNGVMITHHNGELCPATFMDSNELAQHLDKRTKYPIKAFLLGQPHPYADLIKIWADTGCEVWIKPHKPYSFKISDYENNPDAKLLVDESGVIIVTTKPDWNTPGAEYRLTPPFED